MVKGLGVLHSNIKKMLSEIEKNNPINLIKINVCALAVHFHLAKFSVDITLKVPCKITKILAQYYNS